MKKNGHFLKIIISLSLLSLGSYLSAQTLTTEEIANLSADKCIKFTDLTNPDVVTAKYGIYGQQGQMPYTGVNDLGYDNPNSQHTVHYIQDEYDAFTGGDKFKTIPEGELASVRLGTYTGDGGAESLIYTFTVNPESPVLLIKYAAVMENINHTSIGNEITQPRFIVRITDMNDNLLDDCLNVSFLADDLLDWNQILGDNETHFPIIWKDWTTMGINLNDYIGKQIKLYLETGDCFPEAFPSMACRAYAYFTLDCTSDRLEREGETLCAPKGFNYRWYKITEPDATLSINQCFTLQAEEIVAYECELSSVVNGKESCTFTLTTTTQDRYPDANISYTLYRNTVELFDRSSVYAENGVINERCNIYWDIDGTISYERNPVHTFTVFGEKRVVLHASVDGGAVIDRDTVILTVLSPEVNLGNDIILNDFEDIVLDAGVGFKTYLWSTGETTQTITITNPNREYIKAGEGVQTNAASNYLNEEETLEFWVKVTDYNNNESIDSITITFSANMLDNLISNKDISIQVFPNPVRDLLNISFGNGECRRIEFLDISGKVMYQREHTGSIVKIEISSLNRGIYLLRVNGEFITKIVLSN